MTKKQLKELIKECILEIKSSNPGLRMSPKIGQMGDNDFFLYIKKNGKMYYFLDPDPMDVGDNNWGLTLNDEDINILVDKEEEIEKKIPSAREFLKTKLDKTKF
jgi:hypothetical protein